ncbi:MAG: diiron oxygenase [Bacteroidota bacterium]
MTTFPVQKIERLIRISKEKPLLPEQFVPWQEPAEEADLFLPEKLVSLAGHPLYERLSPAQRRELGRHEVVQVMYSYGWSEGLACLFFNRHLLDLSPGDVEYRFLLRELIEEFRHQEMFSKAIEQLDGKPILPGFQHRFWGKLTVKFLPSDWVFMSVLAVEMMADVYGKLMRRDPRVYQVLRKVSELHHIEEGRHIHYTKLWLERYTQNAGFLRRTWYSLLFLLNIYFMRTLYVRREIFERIGVDRPAHYQKTAYRHFKHKFAEHCLDEAIEFMEDIGGFNWLTRPLWRLILKAKV